jgi:hypothetical protein
MGCANSSKKLAAQNISPSPDQVHTHIIKYYKLLGDNRRIFFASGLCCWDQKSKNEILELLDKKLDYTIIIVSNHSERNLEYEDLECKKILQEG